MRMRRSDEIYGDVRIDEYRQWRVSR
jgi:hypothetical protein